MREAEMETRTAELLRALAESREARDRRLQKRRASERFPLSDAFGSLVYMGNKTPCQFLNLSETGCAVQTEKPFRPGSLAPVDVILPIFGMILRIGGVTQWTKQEKQIGIRFTHANNRSKTQLLGLISCLLDQSAIENVKRTLASPALNPVAGIVLTVQHEKPGGGGSTTVSKIASGAFDPAVHNAERRIRSRTEGAWKAVLRSLNQRAPLAGPLCDLSLAGCTIQPDPPFAGEVQDKVEVEFTLMRIACRLGGIVMAVYPGGAVGVQFTPMSPRRLDELRQLILDLSMSKDCDCCVSDLRPAP
jgi:hypothetical protein